MAETLLSIESVTFAGEDLTVFPVDSFAWGSSDATSSSMLTLVVVRPVNDLSADVALLHQSGEPRAVSLTCTDDAGGIRLQLRLTGARVTNYSITGGLGVAEEQLTFNAASVEMTTGSSFAIFS
jgi:hypothetical protein